MIHCQKCKHQNVTEASACEQCGANLLPSEGLASRIIKALILVSFGTAIIVMGFNWLEIDVYIYSIAALGLLLILIGIVALVRKTPLYRRYETRANRHFKRDPQQALSDLNTAIALAPKRIPFSVNNFFKILGTAAGKAYNSLRGVHRRSSLRLKDEILSRPKVRLVS
ncbi:MAG TPA: hypothetical protein VLM78_02295, partial [Anaerolineales bacterium]|nr:hypothetical protein [Anaerolineales bacterium]